jgi:hypothetical protein
MLVDMLVAEFNLVKSFDLFFYLLEFFLLITDISRLSNT